MRGGLSYSEAHYLSPSEREMISDIIKENLETTKETKRRAKEIGRAHV